LSSCSDGTAVLSQTVTAERVLIAICTTVGGWSTAAVDNLLRANALDLDVVGPSLTVQVATGVPSSTGASAACCDANGQRYNYRAYMSLNPSSSSSFASAPDAIMAHEYGHAWTQYWRYMNPTNNGSWSAYNSFRWANADGSQTLAQHSKLNTTYGWMDYEMAADDYRRLFGSARAQAQLGFLNSGVPDSKQVVGLAAFFLDTWR
jgi:hypothetical protein